MVGLGVIQQDGTRSKGKRLTGQLSLPVHRPPEAGDHRPQSAIIFFNSCTSRQQEEKKTGFSNADKGAPLNQFMDH